MLVVAVIVAVVASTGVPGAITSGIERALCEVTQRDGCRSPSEGSPPAGSDQDRSANPERAPSAAAAVPPSPGFGPSSTGSAPDVPGPPEPPAPPTDNLDGSGEFDSEDPGILGDLQNDALEELAYRGADTFEALGRQDAARHMRHFLGESGEPLEVDPARMLRDIDFFRTRERAERDDLVRDIQEEAARRYQGEAFSFTVDDRGWTPIPSDPTILGDNWFYALGGFSFTQTASVTVTPERTPGEPPEVEIDYQTHVFDRYNWDKGKSVTIGPVTISDEELQDLHRAGLAQDFDVYGTTDTESVTVDADPDPGSGAEPEQPPTPSAPDGDGDRRDPGRDRGRDDRREPSDRDREGRGGS